MADAVITTDKSGGISLFQNEFRDLRELKNAKLINGRRVINGSDDGLMQIHPLKHPFGFELYEQMIKNTWTISEIDTARDAQQIKDGPLPEQQRAYRLMTAALLTQSGMQAKRLSDQLIRPVTSPEVVLGLVRLAFEKAMHVHNISAYCKATGIDAGALYTLAEDDDYLRKRTKRLHDAYQDVLSPTFATGTRQSDTAYLKACMTSVMIEGICARSIFLLAYSERRKQHMPGYAELARRINLDADLHLRLFAQIAKTIIAEQPELWTSELGGWAKSATESIAEEEYLFAEMLLKEGRFALQKDELRAYLHYLGDLVLETLGLPKAWNVKNPYLWTGEITQNARQSAANRDETTSGALEWD